MVYTHVIFIDPPKVYRMEISEEISVSDEQTRIVMVSGEVPQDMSRSVDKYELVVQWDGKNRTQTSLTPELRFYLPCPVDKKN